MELADVLKILIGAVVGGAVTWLYAPLIEARKERGRVHTASRQEGLKELGRWLQHFRQSFSVCRLGGYTTKDVRRPSEEVCQLLEALLNLELPPWQSRLLRGRLILFSGSYALAVEKVGCKDLADRQGFNVQLLEQIYLWFDLEPESIKWLGERHTRFLSYKENEWSQILAECGDIEATLRLRRWEFPKRRKLRAQMPNKEISKVTAEVS